MSYRSRPKLIQLDQGGMRTLGHQAVSGHVLTTFQNETKQNAFKTFPKRPSARFVLPCHPGERYS